MNHTRTNLAKCLHKCTEVWSLQDSEANKARSRVGRIDDQATLEMQPSTIARLFLSESSEFFFRSQIHRYLQVPDPR